ncbi:PAS domain S-box protein [Anaerotruncus sp. AF02-27]|nr:PAS domain S-box protein [Anaerotruncus sp. AF02-27]
MYWSLCATSILLVLLTMALTLWSVYGLLVRQAKTDLRQEYNLIARSITYAAPNAADYLDSLDLRLESFRVTMIAPDGTVLFDTDNNSNKMENHLSRPEIASALETGKGEDIRRSETMGLDSFYYAEKLPDGSVLRVSNQTRSIGAVFVSIIPLIAGIVLVILVAGMAIASRLTRRMLRPIEELAKNIGNTDTLEGYEELEPFFVKIREQNRLISQQMEHLREERDTIRTITSNMKEGLVLLDRGRSILSVNRSAISLLGAKSADYTGKNLLNLSRGVEMDECVGRALAGASADVVVDCDGRACHIFASPVLNAGEVCGAIVLIMDVTEQQKAEKIRRDFTANVSHELKTPLTSISGFAEMIENGMVGQEADVKKFAGRIYREASRLITLTDDIIRLARIEEDGRADMEPVDLKAVADSVVNTLAFTAEQKQVAIAAGGGPLTVQGNARMLEELVYNLAENAVKYNRPGGRVDIGVRREGDCAVLTVSDTGIGIPKEHQERIFERFYRVDKSRSKQTGGTGLGLSIVKHIVERHGGTISLVSAQDAGTTVTARIPLQ